LGDVPACQSCARLDEAELHLKPEIEWIKSEAMLGGDLSRALQAVYRNRSNGKQFYLSLTPGVGNPVFQNEPGYGAVNLPDPASSCWHSIVSGTSSSAGFPTAM
jgi:hypothetical protein